MFAKLTGTIDTLFPEALILDVNGVGYHVFASGRTLAMIGNQGDRASLLIETHVREDHIHLYGFASTAERDWFRLLTSVQGVGAKSGLSILSVCAPDRLAVAIASGDATALRQADGVGPKLATRIVTELKDKAAHMAMASVPVAADPESTRKKSGKAAAGAASSSSATSATGPSAAAIDQDAVSALVNLGYGRSEAFSAVIAARQKAGDTSPVTIDTLIKLALKELMR